ncbi:MAG: hypothetical protein CSA20_01125 [Deltaproteobacteria bacterium]|nr:MAG: hypothetical protein CSA20_01125 [Deltaproteobacteria bacterium]
MKKNSSRHSANKVHNWQKPDIRFTDAKKEHTAKTSRKKQIIVDLQPCIQKRKEKPFDAEQKRRTLEKTDGTKKG